MAPVQHLEELIPLSPREVFSPISSSLTSSPPLGDCHLLEMSSSLGWMVFVSRKLYHSIRFLVRESHLLECNNKCISAYSSLGCIFKSLEESCPFLLSSVKVLKWSLLSCFSSIHRHGSLLPGPMVLNLHPCIVGGCKEGTLAPSWGVGSDQGGTRGRFCM